MLYFDGEEGRIRAETMEIAVGLICQIPLKTTNYTRIKNQVDQLIHRHEILFTGMLRKLDSLSLSINKDEIHRQDMIDDLLCLDLTRIFDSLIQHDNITWGKIITIFAFSTFIARKHCEIADRIACVTGQYVVKKSSTWIQDHGGWDSIVLMDSTYDMDNLNRLLTFSLTCIGLSIVGLFLALR